MNFGERFKKARISCDLTQKQVAEKLGISQSCVSDWERDISRPEYENLIKLSKLYEESIDYLLNNI